MNRKALGDDLNDLLAIATRGLLCFLDQSTPYLTPQTHRMWSDIRKMVQGNAEHAERLTEILESLRIPFRAASFSLDVASLHYMTLETTLPMLADQMRRQADTFQLAIKHGASNQPLHNALTSMLANTETWLKQLEAHLKSISAEPVPTDTPSAATDHS